jgi:hypothetical protein
MMRCAWVLPQASHMHGGSSPLSLDSVPQVSEDSDPLCCCRGTYARDIVVCVLCWVLKHVAWRQGVVEQRPGLGPAALLRSSCSWQQ